MSFVQKYFGVRCVSKEARQAALDRVHLDPGIPDPKHTSEPFWLKTPHPQVAKKQSKNLLEEADIVIIGSGITGASIAYNFFEHSGHLSSSEGNSRPSVVILEARDASSGATGRNGGHILEMVEEYLNFKSYLGGKAASKLIQFKLAHLDAMLELADKLSLKDSSQIRKVQFVNVFFEEEAFVDACDNLAEFKEDMPLEAEDFISYSAEEAREVSLIAFLYQYAFEFIFLGRGGSLY
jgi:hypothetical protein